MASACGSLSAQARRVSSILVRGVVSIPRSFASVPDARRSDVHAGRCLGIIKGLVPTTRSGSSFMHDGEE